MHNFCRYALILTSGPSIMFELPTSIHLLNGLETIDEVRPAWSTDFLFTGFRTEEMVTKWAQEIDDLVRNYCGDNRRLAIDRLNVDTAHALIKCGAGADGREKGDGTCKSNQVPRRDSCFPVFAFDLRSRDA